MAFPKEESYSPAFHGYIQLAKADTILEPLHKQQEQIEHFFSSIPSEKADYAYAPGKWTLKMLLQHLIDTERIFSYRALCIARKEKQSLPGFEENEYADAADVSHRGWQQLCDELIAVRKSTTLLIESFTDEMLETSGISNGAPITVNALCYSMIGHVTHHINVVKERYL